MQATKLEPGQDGWVEQTRAAWHAHGVNEPDSMIVIEYHGNGDPFFGGGADDRALGPQGMILERHQRLNQAPLEFTSVDAVHEACKGIKNRRAGSLLGIAPRWNRVSTHPTA